MSSFRKQTLLNNPKRTALIKKEQENDIKIKKARHVERMRQEELRRQVELRRQEDIIRLEDLRLQEVSRRREDLLFRLSFNYINTVEHFHLYDEVPILEEIIPDNLPKLSEKDFNKLNKCKYNNMYNSTCTICFDEFELNTDIIQLNCNHNYHTDCICEWLCNNSDKCPLCKIPAIS